MKICHTIVISPSTAVTQITEPLPPLIAKYHVVLALLCHDIVYVRGVCPADRPGEYSTDRAGQTVTLPPGAPMPPSPPIM
jgi:hypothetical protein